MIIDWLSDKVKNKDPSWVLTAVGGRRLVTTDAEVIVPLATRERDNNCEFAIKSTWITIEAKQK